MKRLSPSIVTAVATVPAIYFAYRGFNVFEIAAVLVIAQMALGLVLRKLKKHSTSLDLARSGIAILALWGAFFLNSESMVWRQRVEFCLKGDLPTHISDFEGYEDIWTDYVITMKFKADSESIRKVLQNGKFRIQEPLSSSESRVYVPVDGDEKVLHRVTTDSAYSFMFIEYAAD